MSELPDPIGAFLTAHKMTLSKAEEEKLKDRIRHRKAYVQKTSNAKWKEDHAKNGDVGPRDVL